MSKTNQIFFTWFSLRTLVVLLAIAILLVPTKPAVFEGLDRLLFAIGNNLLNAPSPNVDIAVITLPEQEYTYLNSELGQAQQSARLLQQLLNDGNRVVGVVLNQVPTQSQSPAQQLLEQVGGGEGIDKELKNQINRYNRTYAAMVQHFDNPRVLRGIELVEGVFWPLAFDPTQTLVVEETTSSDLIHFLPPWMRPSLTELPTQSTNKESTAPGNQLAPLYLHERITKPLVLSSEQGLQSEFLVNVYARRGQQNTITWLANQGLQINTANFPLSPDGSFVPIYHQSPAIPQLTLARALDNLPSEKIVLIGAENSAALRQAANDLLSFDNQHYFYSTAWMYWAQLLATAFILFYLVVLIPKMSRVSAVFASCLFFLIFVVAQLGWQITQWQYLPLGVPMQYLLLGHVLMFIWTLQRDNWNQLQAAAHGARYQLGLQLFRDGRPDDALLALKECYSSDAVLALMYDIGTQQERKRQYGEAVKTYQAIVKRQSSYRDTREKIEKLIAFSSTGTGSFGADSTIAKTLIISESSINKPVLGRYEIERELGRGAMGIVYLGRDPKISRQVAIKTLSYNNIATSELDEFKERFFREAEAAGRLNHPNIVTIYDVGEEHDLAFIAMDYVEGVSLSAHSDADHLLAVDEVYQIIIDVAEALHYAHSKNVVHRDIKPSNIMFEPNSGKVKVTDFGVARIIDNTKTQTGDILGSPLYMSPEQLKAARVTEQTDIYSLGVTFYQLLTGKLPHKGDNLANLTYAIIHEKPVSVREHRSDLPKNVTRIINKAMHKEPGKRYQHAGDFAAAVRRALQDDFAG